MYLFPRIYLYLYLKFSYLYSYKSSFLPNTFKESLQIEEQNLRKKKISLQWGKLLFSMAQVTQNDFTFTILDEVESKYPELVKLILWSESIDNNEKQYWFDIIPSMTDEQIDRLFNILETERRQLEELNIKYQEEIKTLNEKHLIQWQSLQSQKAKQKIQEAEQNDTSNAWADDVLDMLNQL